MIHQIQNGQQAEIGQAVIPLSKVLSAPLSKTPQAMVRVYQDYVDVKDAQTGHLKCNLQIIIYLEDNGTAKVEAGSSNKKNNLQAARAAAKTNTSNMNLN